MQYKFLSHLTNLITEKYNSLTNFNNSIYYQYSNSISLTNFKHFIKKSNEKISITFNICIKKIKRRYIKKRNFS